MCRFWQARLHFDHARSCEGSIFNEIGVKTFVYEIMNSPFCYL